MLSTISLFIYFFMIPWGAVQFASGRGWDWLVLTISGLIVWRRILKEGTK